MANSVTRMAQFLPAGEAHRAYRAALAAQAARDDQGWSAAAATVRDVAARESQTLEVLCEGLQAALLGNTEDASAALAEYGERLVISPALSAAIHQNAHLLTSEPGRRLARLRLYARSRARTGGGKDWAAALQLYEQVERDALRLGNHEMVCAGISGQAALKRTELPQMEQLARRGLAYVDEHVPESAYWRFIFVNLLATRPSQQMTWPLQYRSCVTPSG